MIIEILLLIAVVVFAVRSVMARSLLKAVIALAFTSATLTVIMFRLMSPLAAVFELSVCTGLITAVFISTVSLTKPLSHSEILEVTKGRIKRYWPLFLLLMATAALFALVKLPVDIKLPAPLAAEDTVNNMIWNLRQVDILGQAVVLLAGVMSIIVLFKEVRKK